eukprot:15358445-Ditylum_brightwellii.AAC.1
MDIKLHSDSVHCWPISVVPAAMQAMRGAFLMTVPGLMKHMYHVNICGKSSKLKGVYSILGKRGGTIIDTSNSLSMNTIVASMPVQSEFGLTGDLSGATHGHHIPAEEEGLTISDARLQKQLDAKVPAVESFVNKL